MGHAEPARQRQPRQVEEAVPLVDRIGPPASHLCMDVPIEGEIVGQLAGLHVESWMVPSRDATHHPATRIR
jgi:hypothetical protein